MLYFLKLSISLSVVYLFYQVLLRRLTFYNWNRWYLLVYSALCFVIPLVDVFGFLKQQGLQNAVVISYVPAITQITTSGAGTRSAGISTSTICIGIFITGCLLLLVRLLIQFLSLRRLRTSAVLLTGGSVKIYHIDKKIIPFTAGNAIYVNRHLHNEDELREIIRHEFIHVKQRHSIDLWWGEMLCILNWYNPFAWLLRNAMRQNLEFIADHQVLQSGLDIKQYQYLLLKVTGHYSFSIASNFNLSSLKKRIAMMNKNKSANRHLVRFLFMLPLLAVILLAFREVAVSGNNYYAERRIADTIPAPPPSRGTTDLFKQKGIKSINVQRTNKEHKAYVELSNGTKKVYDLNKPAEKEAFEEEYGDLVPPPPPVPARAPKPASAPVAPAAATPAAPTNAPVAAPPPPTPPIPPTPPVKDQTMVGNVMIRDAVYEAPAKLTAMAGVGTISNVPVETTTLKADLIEIRPAVAIGGIAEVEGEKVQIAEIKNTTTREELGSLLEELKAKGYTLSLTNMNFDNGKLTALQGSIGNSTGKVVFAAGDFKTVTISVSKNNSDRFYVWIHNGTAHM